MTAFPVFFGVIFNTCFAPQPVVLMLLHVASALIRGKKHLQEPVAQPERLEEYLLEGHCRTEPTRTSDPFLAAARFELERTGDLPQAQEFLERCLVMHYGGHGNTNNLDAAAALFELGRSCRQAGDLLQAQGLLKECLQMQRGLHGNTHHFDIAAVLFELGCLCRQAADLPQAQKFLKECSQMQRGLHGNIIHF